MPTTVSRVFPTRRSLRICCVGAGCSSAIWASDLPLRTQKCQGWDLSDFLFVTNKSLSSSPVNSNVTYSHPPKGRGHDPMPCSKTVIIPTHWAIHRFYVFTLFYQVFIIIYWCQTQSKAMKIQVNLDCVCRWQELYSKSSVVWGRRGF